MRRAHDDEKKDHRGRQADDHEQRDADRPPFRFREPAAKPLLNQAAAIRTRKRLAADFVTARRTGEDRRPLGKRLHQPNDSSAGQCRNRNGPIVGFAEPVRVGPDRRPMLRREGMAAPGAMDRVARTCALHLDRRITNGTKKLEHDGTSGTSRLIGKRAALMRLNEPPFKMDQLRG